jgi:hypothetical protein
VDSRDDTMIFQEIFTLGCGFFNQGKYNKAHIAWEDIWKNGNDIERAEIKGFIQLTGAILNTQSGKISSGQYLFEKSISNISSVSVISDWIRIKPLLDIMVKCLEQLEINPYETFPYLEIQLNLKS